MMIKTENATIAFGGLKAVNKVNFELEEGMLASVIGPNGAGKTTFFNLLTGQYKATEGQVFLNGRDITSMVPAMRTVWVWGDRFS